MQRAVTAIYRTFEVADLVRRDLEQLGIAGHNVTVLPDGGTAGGSTFGTSGDVDWSDSLYRLGLPEDDARTYRQALQNGDYVVSVEVDDDADLGRIQAIMRRPEDAYDLDELDTRYRDADDAMPRQQAAYADTRATGQMGGDLDRDGTVRVVEERLDVGKQEVDRGAVRVRSYVREVPVEADVELRSTRVYVERRPVDRAVSPGDIPMGEQVIEARERIEEPVVTKQARVVEEIGLRQETDVERQHVRDTVRKTEVEVEDERTGERTSLTGGTTTPGSGSSGSGRF